MDNNENETTSWSRACSPEPAHSELKFSFDPRAHLRISMCGEEFNALLDSGASVSLISSEIAVFCEDKGHRASWAQNDIRVADGTLYTPEYKFWLPLTIGSRRLSHTFVEFPDLIAPIIIGADLLTRLKLDVPYPPARATRRKPRLQPAPGTPEVSNPRPATLPGVSITADSQTQTDNFEKPMPKKPPVLVYANGRTVEVPFYAAHITRMYKVRLTNPPERWVFRFSRKGEVNFARKIE